MQPNPDRGTTRPRAPSAKTATSSSSGSAKGTGNRKPKPPVTSTPGYTGGGSTTTSTSYRRGSSVAAAAPPPPVAAIETPYSGGGGGRQNAPAVPVPPTLPAGFNAPMPPTIAYPTAAQMAYNAQGIPGSYANWFAYTFSPFENYYTPERGGQDQAAEDYRTLVAMWQGATGRYPTAEEIARLMSTFYGYSRAQLGRTPNVGDLYSWAARQWQRPAQPPQVSYLFRGGGL